MSRRERGQENTEHKRRKLAKFSINDHVDIVVEVLKRLDGRSLGVAACVCRLWCSVTRNDALWEHMCFGGQYQLMRSFSKDVRPVVLALGGYKRLYMVSLRPLLSRLDHRWRRRSSVRREEVQLSLSLFCVDYYERLGSSASSLMFLHNRNPTCNNPSREYPINV